MSKYGQLLVIIKTKNQSVKRSKGPSSISGSDEEIKNDSSYTFGSFVNSLNPFGSRVHRRKKAGKKDSLS